MNVMLLAAGEGTRLRPYTSVLPKPAIPFLTIPLAAHVLSFLGDLEINKLVVNTFHLPQGIHDLFHTLPTKAQSVIFSDEVGFILGNGGGLGKAATHFRGGGSFLLMNADEIILPKEEDVLQKALARHNSQKNIATLIVKDHPGVGTKFGGVWVDANNKVLGFGKTPVPGAVRAWHFVGVQILDEKILDFIPPNMESNILYDAVTVAISQGHSVEAVPFEGTWFETGNPQDFMEASKTCLEYLTGEDSYQKKALQLALQRYSTEKTSATRTASSLKLVAESAEVKSSSIKGVFCAGPGAVIEEGCELTDVVVGRNVRVPAGTKASNVLFI
ncbi:sugar phosphate nucleotidyltransferase [Bdellovibrio bacteriovorus]|uniref:sugar phosphate nucleotidyltransferase n=1 Tax=Bdellovibrio bacteriovorus TaxID=959 RepID=UPI0021CF65B8|nr:sugar phosphate nucleotidyltransferase [Bdellovibrio bacteriovorus]UXR65872.1 sugar phosphate nucleotidyltransferase [Bdellovibrio bacteriovorus]